jgi:hypothetical protein
MELAELEEAETAEEAEAGVTAGVGWEADCWVAAALEVEHAAEVSSVEAKAEGSVVEAELEEAVVETAARKEAMRISGTAGRRRLRACSNQTPRIRLALLYIDLLIRYSCKRTWPSIHTSRSTPRTRECTSCTRRKATPPGEAMRVMQAMQAKEESWAASCWKSGC